MYFQQGRLTLSKPGLWVPRKVTPGHPGWIWLVKRPGLICLAVRWSGSATGARRFRPFWIISFEFVKVCWIRFSSWKSFVGFYIWCYPISTILACLFYCWNSNFVENVVFEREHAWRPRCHSCLRLVYYIVWSANLTKLSWNFVWD